MASKRKLGRGEAQQGAGQGRRTREESAASHPRRGGLRGARLRAARAARTRTLWWRLPRVILSYRSPGAARRDGSAAARGVPLLRLRRIHPRRALLPRAAAGTRDEGGPREGGLHRYREAAREEFPERRPAE